MPELLGFETMLIIHPYGMAVHARVVAGLVFSLLFKLVSSYCGQSVLLKVFRVSKIVNGGLVLKQP